MRIESLLPVVLLTLALAGCQPANPVLEIEGGKIQGVESTVDGVYIYKGIPFAAPPVGDLRWKEPQPVIPWEGVKVADTFGPGSVQVNHDSSNPWTSEFYWEDPEFSEDCLYLNVWTPAPGKPGKKLPVAMWIHGGAYTGGWGYEPEFDGKVWAERGVVLVTINYRLGVFGFLVHPFLTAESPHHVSGNYGLLDQIAALKWVHANIAAFGGDPDNITILGQSAGAGSVKALVSSPLTGDLITGFPGETEADQAATLAFLEKCAFADLHIFPYSRRPGTPADKMPGQCTRAVKERRAHEAQAVMDRLRRAYREGCVGQTLPVLFETEDAGHSTGHSDSYMPVTVEGTKLRGQVRNVRITAAAEDGLTGVLEDCEKNE